MGTFQFQAALVSSDCPFSEALGQQFSFEGTFSRERDSGTAFFTMAGLPHPAEFDGQQVVAHLSAARVFSQCTSPVEVKETISAALLSRSQLQLLGGCPAEVPEGGWPQNPSEGIFPPRTTEEGFDAVRACGNLRDEVTAPSGSCAGGFPDATRPCRAEYSVIGVRR